MGPKKQKPNGFLVFMQEMKGRLSSEGIRSMTQIQEVCSPMWNNMTAEQKAVYNQKAKGMSAIVKEEKYDTRGVPLIWKENEEKRKLEQVKQMAECIEDMVSHCYQRGVLEAEFFNIAYFNYAVETSEGECPPCEIAVVKYSLSEGIEEYYHEFVEPGKLRLGYSYEAKLHSEKTHKIPTIGFKLASSNYIKITEKIKGMLQQTDGTFAPLFCLDSELKRASYILQWLIEMSRQQDSTYSRENPFRAYSLNKLLYELRRHANLEDSRLTFTSNQMVADKLNSNTFDFSPNMACQWHHEEDCSSYCALTRARNYAYVISDLCCEHYQLNLLPNRHCPALMADESKYEIRPHAHRPREPEEAASVDQEGSTTSDAPRRPRDCGSVMSSRLAANFGAGRGALAGSTFGSSRTEASSPGLSSVTSNSPVPQQQQEEAPAVGRGRGRILMDLD